MQALVPMPLRSTNSKVLFSGLYKILKGIMLELGLQQADIAKILHKPATTVSGWFSAGEVKVTHGRYTPDDVQIYELIELYDSLTSYIVRTEDQIKWLKEPKEAFGNVSALVYMFEHPHHLRDVRMYLESRMSP